MIKTYRKKPTTVEAIQYTGSNLKECKNFAGEQNYKKEFNFPHVLRRSVVLTLVEGDYITKNKEGELDVYRESFFNNTYEEAI